MLYKIETWCLGKDERAVLRRIERAIIRAMCDVKIIKRKNKELKIC